MQWQAVEDPQGEPAPSSSHQRELITAENEVSFAKVCSQATNLPAQMKFPEFHKVLAWMNTIQAEATVPPTWVTWYELFWIVLVISERYWVKRCGKGRLPFKMEGP